MSGGLSFLAALLGGAYWGTKYSNDKTSLKEVREEYDTTHQSDEAKLKEWKSSVTNVEIERDLEERIFQRDEALISEVSGTWADYYDCDMPKLILQSKESYYRFVECPEQSISNLTMLRILMANRGLLTQGDAEIGLSVSLDLGYTASQKSENYSKQIKFVKAIDAKLQEKGVKEPMYIQLSGTANYYAIDSRRISGRVMWRPMIGTFALRATEAWR